jgi:hypothetical protein
MNDEEYLTMAYEEMFAGFSASAAGDLDEEHRRQDAPAYAVLLRRKYATYEEFTWIRVFPAAKTIIVTQPEVTMRPGHTMPGAVRNLPLGWRDLASANALRSRFEQVVSSYVTHGWVRQATATYSTGER